MTTTCPELTLVLVRVLSWLFFFALHGGWTTNGQAYKSLFSPLFPLLREPLVLTGLMGRGNWLGRACLNPDVRYDWVWGVGWLTRTEFLCVPPPSRPSQTQMPRRCSWERMCKSCPVINAWGNTVIMSVVAVFLVDEPLRLFLISH